MKRALVIRNVDYEDLGGFEAVLSRNHAIERIDVDDAAFATLDYLAPDLLVVMGGPMGVYERVEHPWIAGEVAGLRERIAADRPTLGICLGSQMIAAALGARVYAGPVKEVGFAPITLNPAGATTPLRHLAGRPMVHWHGDTFDLPEGVELLASTSLYPHQAFRRGRNILALQFHAEMGEDPRIERWIEHGTAMMAAAGTDGAKVRADQQRYGSAAVEAGQAMLGEWLADLG
jgi:GMP synthase (glutamine-hydrolysing)